MSKTAATAELVNRCASRDASVYAERSCLPKWFLVFTKPSGEKVAEINLERQGYFVYHPRLAKPARYRNRWVDRVVSLFPRYLFVEIDATRQSLAPVRSTVGVVNVVSFGSMPAVVPADIVNGLMRCADPASGLHFLDHNRKLQSGSPVTITAGAFEGLNGIFEKEVGNHRVIVLLRLLGLDTPVRLNAHYVSPAAV